MSFDSGKVRSIIRTALNAVAGVPAVVQYENRSFSSPDSSVITWMRERQTSLTERWAATNTIEHRGDYRVDVMIQSDKGTEALDTIVDNIFTAFPPGRQLTDPTCTPLILRAQRREARQDTQNPVWFYQPIILSWVVYSTF